MISGITENENNKGKERKHWIPNQVGDDIGVVFGDDSYCGFPIKDFGDDKLLWIPAFAGMTKKELGMTVTYKTCRRGDSTLTLRMTGDGYGDFSGRERQCHILE